MSDLFKRADYGFNCPSGGTWYACDKETHFVGCCDAPSDFDVCRKGCPQGNLKAASYDPAHHGEFPDVTCSRSAQPYSCKNDFDGAVPFLGCCKINACNEPGGQCPITDLESAFLGKPSDREAYSATGGSSTPTAAPTSTETSSNSATASPEKDTPIGAIVGGVVGGVAILLILAGILIFFLRRRKKQQADSGSPNEAGYSNVPVFPPPAPEKHQYYPAGSPEAPPVYSSPKPNTAAATFTQHHELDSTQLSPAQNVMPTPVNHHRLSELAGEGVLASELESPWTSPNPSVLQNSTVAGQSLETSHVREDARTTSSRWSGTGGQPTAQEPTALGIRGAEG